MHQESTLQSERWPKPPYVKVFEILLLMLLWLNFFTREQGQLCFFTPRRSWWVAISGLIWGAPELTVSNTTQLACRRVFCKQKDMSVYFKVELCFIAFCTMSPQGQCWCVTSARITWTELLLLLMRGGNLRYFLLQSEWRFHCEGLESLWGKWMGSSAITMFWLQIW